MIKDVPETVSNVDDVECRFFLDLIYIFVMRRTDFNLSTSPFYVPKKSFPLTKDVSDEMERQEKKLQIAEGNKCDSNCHCIAWCIGACTFQRVVGTRMYVTSLHFI